MTPLQLTLRGYMAMVGRMVTILPHAEKKFGLRHSVFAVKYVGAQKFCAMLPRRHPDGVDIVA